MNGFLLLSYTIETFKSVRELLWIPLTNHFSHYTCFHRRQALNKTRLHVTFLFGSANQKQENSKGIFVNSIGKLNHSKRTEWCCPTISTTTIILKQTTVYKAVKEDILAKIYADQWHSAKSWNWNLFLWSFFYIQNYVEKCIFCWLLVIKTLQFLDVPFRNVFSLTFQC